MDNVDIVVLAVFGANTLLTIGWWRWSARRLRASQRRQSALLGQAEAFRAHLSRIEALVAEFTVKVAAVPDRDQGAQLVAELIARWEQSMPCATPTDPPTRQQVDLSGIYARFDTPPRSAPARGRDDREVKED